jgi:hypothetical protein
MSNNKKHNETQPQVTENRPLNLQDLRLNQNFGSQVGVKKLLVTVPVRKPGSQEFVRTYANEKYRGQYALLELKEDRETYLLDPGLCGLVPNDAFPAMLFTTINRQSVLTLWPVKLPREDGKVMAWHSSAMQAAEEAMRAWIKVTSNMTLGAYEIYRAAADIPDPEWPNISFEEILNIGFKGHVITSADHPVIRKLRGEL